MELREERLEDWKEEFENHQKEIKIYKKRYNGLHIFLSVVAVIYFVLGEKGTVLNFWDFFF